MKIGERPAAVADAPRRGSLQAWPIWRCRNNRTMGAAIAVLTALLVVAAFGLYYIGSDTLRGWTSELHLVRVAGGRRQCPRDP